MTAAEKRRWNKKMQKAKEKAKRKREKERLAKLERVGAAPIRSEQPRPMMKGFPNYESMIVAEVYKQTGEGALPTVAAWATAFYPHKEETTTAKGTRV